VKLKKEFVIMGFSGIGMEIYLKIFTCVEGTGGC
jgi:hypothetical protein